MPEGCFFSPLLHRAMEIAAHAHGGQRRKGSEVPYMSHPAMVGLILLRAGFDEDTVAAGLLHDVVEDTGMSLDYLSRELGPRVAALVGWMSETKTDAAGVRLPWEVRKQVHFEKLIQAPVEARAIALADKLHNLNSVLIDLESGREVWHLFRAPRERWLWNAARVIEACGQGDRRLEALATEGRQTLERLAQR